MADLPKFNDLFQIGANKVLTFNAGLTIESVNRPGSDLNVDVAAAAAIGDECIGQLTIVKAGTFLDSASGTALDRLLFDRYGLLRKPAAPAVGSASFQVTSGGVAANNPTSFVIPAGTVIQSSNGLQYITTVSSIYSAGSAGPLVVAVASVLAGANQQASQNTLTSLVSQIANGPASPLSLTVNNPLATAGAADAEDDPSFRARGRAFFSTARRGTLDALVQGAIAVPGVATAEAFELIDALGRPARYVELVVSDAYTDSLATLSTVPATYQTQSQLLALTVFNALDSVRAAGIYVQTFVAQVILQPVQLNLSFVAGVDVDATALQARSVVVMYTNSLSPGQTWSRAGAQGAVASVPGLQITGNEIASPSGDVVPTPLQVIRTSLAITSAVALGTGTVLNATINPDA